MENEGVARHPPQAAEQRQRQRQRRVGERDVPPLAVLRQRYRQDTPPEVDMLPAGPQHLVLARAGQRQQADGLGGHAVGLLGQHGQQTDVLGVGEELLAVPLRQHARALGRVAALVGAPAQGQGEDPAQHGEVAVHPRVRQALGEKPAAELRHVARLHPVERRAPERGQDPPTAAAAALMTAGLAAKMALFPLHLWLSPAHAGAPPAASAVLSGLVVKAAFVLLLRLWFWVMPPVLAGAAAPLLAALGAAAILVGSLVALRQERLKLLVAYSTVAQIGYLFLMFPLMLAGDAEITARVWLGGVLQAASHAFAKAAMFLSAGLMAKALGHDRVAALAGAGQAMPAAVIAFGLAGLSLMGVPPSGGFTAKWLLLTSSIATGQWWWAGVILGGGLLTGGYVYRVLAGSLTAPPAASPAPAPMLIGPQRVALALALVSVGLGLLPLASFGLVQIGRPGLAAGGLP